MSKKPIGLIGLGAIGSAFADRLLQTGRQIIGHDISRAARDKAQSRGIQTVQDIAVLAERCDVIVSSLPSVEALETVVEELLQVERQETPGWLLETSTFTAAAKGLMRSKLSQANWSVNDLTVSGHPSMVRDDTYTLYVSGPDRYRTEVVEVIEGLSGSPVDAGDFGNAATIKLIVNLMVISHDAVTAEAMTLAERAGLDPGFAYDLIKASAGNSRIFEVRGKMMIDADYPAHDSMYRIIVDKDGPLIADLARELRHPVPVFSLALQAHVGSMALGWGEYDPASVAELYRRASVPVSPGA